MKQPRKPTREQKMIIRKNGYDPNEYGIVRGSERKDSFRIIHMETKKQEQIYY